MFDFNDATTYAYGDPDWEPDTFDAIDEYVKGGVFVDIGAWVGPFALYASRVASRVYAFEPDRMAFDALTLNLHLNRITNVVALPLAVWDVGEVVTLHRHETWGDSMTGPKRSGDGESFPCIHPNAVKCLAGDVQLVKVDIEGGESEIAGPILDWGCAAHISVHEPALYGAMPDFSGREKNMRREGNSAFYSLTFPPK